MAKAGAPVFVLREGRISKRDVAEKEHEQAVTAEMEALQSMAAAAAELTAAVHSLLPSGTAGETAARIAPVGEQRTAMARARSSFARSSVVREEKAQAIKLAMVQPDGQRKRDRHHIVRAVEPDAMAPGGDDDNDGGGAPVQRE
jgi:hypothetical protein